MVQHHGGSPPEAASPAASGNGPADRPGRPGADLPDGAHHAGGSADRWITIPEEILDIYRLWRPTPLFRAVDLEKRPRHTRPDLLQVRRGEPGGQPQAEHRRSPRPTTTRRKGSSASPPRPAPGSGAPRSRFACNQFGLECKVYMVKVSYHQKPYRRSMMETWGGEGRREPIERHDDGPEDPREGPEQPRQPRHRDQRGGRGRGDARRHEVLARQRAESRPAAPDGDRTRGEDGSSRRRATTRTS